MKYDFETRVDRTNRGNLKALLFTPDQIREKGFVSYSGAEFEFKTAAPVIEAMKETAENGLLGFTVADDHYLSHIVWWMEEVRKVSIRPEWILPVQGTIFSVATAIRIFTEAGDGVIIPVPGYNRYEQAAVRLGRKASLSRLTENYRLDFEDLEQQMQDPVNKLLILCNPNNPTGTVFSEEELEQVLALARKYQTAVLCDEIFADVVFGEKAVPHLAALSREDDPVISVISQGKTFSLTGVNHADVVIKNPILRERYRKQRDADHFGSIEPMAYAAVCGGYSPEGKEWLEELIQVVWENKERLVSFFQEQLPTVKIWEPEGTYVVWADFSGLGLSEDELFEFLEKEAYFCSDHGEEYYGAPCMARICTAVPPRELERSLAVLSDAARRRGFHLL
jgi:cystathionine beta-lyase